MVDWVPPRRDARAPVVSRAPRGDYPQSRGHLKSVPMTAPSGVTPSIAEGPAVGSGRPRPRRGPSLRRGAVFHKGGGNPLLWGLSPTWGLGVACHRLRSFSRVCCRRCAGHSPSLLKCDVCQSFIRLGVVFCRASASGVVLRGSIGALGRWGISRIRVVVARASVTPVASSLRQGQFLTLELRPGGWRAVQVCGSGVGKP